MALHGSCMVIYLAAVTLILQRASAQIPADCADAQSLDTQTCCPNNCGEADGRGVCADVDLPGNYSISSPDARANWPHYFTRACRCTGNYWGNNCSRCKYGYYGEDCSQQQTLPRRSIQELTNEEWRDYIQILKWTRNHTSEYVVILNEAQPGNTDIQTQPIHLYDLFVWLHHYAAKDNENTDGKLDYAHEATGFPTWHRQFMLWLEWEIQYMLKGMEWPDWYNFRLHYWDWRREVQMNSMADSLFEVNRLGVSRMTDGQVIGDLFNEGWNTICWYDGTAICDPRSKTEPLRRCPRVDNGINPCTPDNDNWPTKNSVNKAIGKPEYDTDNYMLEGDTSFRNFMEGFEVLDRTAVCDQRKLCSMKRNKPTQRHLHNAIHIIVGLGDFNRNFDPNHMKGVMANVAASPNDPMFINHHAMVDCILEEWLKQHPDAEYPREGPKQGHGINDYMVPFFPLVKHSDMFKTADNFGYSCRLPDITVPGSNPSNRPGGGSRSTAVTLQPLPWLFLIAIMGSIF